MTRELILFQEHHITTRAAAAQRLRDLASMIERQTFTLGDHNVSLPQEVSFKVEYDEEEDGFEFELELRWQPWEAMTATDIVAK